MDYGLLGRWFDPVAERCAAGAGLHHGAVPSAASSSCGRSSRWTSVLGGEPRGGVRVLRRCVARMVPDNLKTGVIKPDLYDPLINKAFGEFAAHYGCLVDPARVVKPRDKGRVERSVPYCRDSFFAGREASSRTSPTCRPMRCAGADEVANQRPHRGLERVAPQVLFEAEERALLGVAAANVL